MIGEHGGMRMSRLRTVMIPLAALLAGASWWLTGGVVLVATNDSSRGIGSLTVAYGRGVAQLGELSAGATKSKLLGRIGEGAQFTVDSRRGVFRGARVLSYEGLRRSRRRSTHDIPQRGLRYRSDRIEPMSTDHGLARLLFTLSVTDDRMTEVADHGGFARFPREERKRAHHPHRAPGLHVRDRLGLS